MYIGFGQYVIFAEFLVCLVRSLSTFKDDTGVDCLPYDMIRQVDNGVVNQCLAVILVGSLGNDTITSWNNYYTTTSNANSQQSYKLVQISYKTFVNSFNKSMQPKTMADLKNCLIKNGGLFGESITNDDMQCPVKNMH